MASPKGAPDPRRRTARGEHTRQRLLQAAEAVFAEQGFHASSISDLTGRAGVGLGTFYFYFPSKLEIFRALVQHLAREVRRETAAAAAGAPDRVQAEQRAMLAFFAYAARHPNLYRVLTQAEWVDPASARAYWEDFAKSYTRVLADAQARGEVRQTDPETLAYCLMGAAEMLNRRWIAWAAQAPPPEVVAAVQQFLAAALRPTER